MHTPDLIGLMIGTTWASGLNVYGSVALLGLADRLGWVALPASMEPITSGIVLALALLMYAVEFVVDKIPWVDSLWDSIHAFIRPLGGGALAYLAAADASHSAQWMASLAGGSLALDAHALKATVRSLINLSPEPFTNWTASVAEDVAVAGLIGLAIADPTSAAVVVGGLVLGSLRVVLF